MHAAILAKRARGRARISPLTFGCWWKHGSERDVFELEVFVVVVRRRKRDFERPWLAERLFLRRPAENNVFSRLIAGQRVVAFAFDVCQLADRKVERRRRVCLQAARTIRIASKISNAPHAIAS